MPLCEFMIKKNKMRASGPRVGPIPYAKVAQIMFAAMLHLTAQTDAQLYVLASIICLNLILLWCLV